MADTTNVLPNVDELSRKADEIYKAIPEDERKTNNGKYIAIETESGEYFIGETKEDAISQSRNKYPNKIVFVRRIGVIEKIAQYSPLSLGKDKSYARIF